MFGQNMTEHNPAPSPSGHPLLSGPLTLYLIIATDIHQIFTERQSYLLRRGMRYYSVVGPAAPGCLPEGYSYPKPR